MGQNSVPSDSRCERLLKRQLGIYLIFNAHIPMHVPPAAEAFPRSSVELQSMELVLSDPRYHPFAACLGRLCAI